MPRNTGPSKPRSTVLLVAECGAREAACRIGRLPTYASTAAVSSLARTRSRERLAHETCSQVNSRTVARRLRASPYGVLSPGRITGRGGRGGRARPTRPRGSRQASAARSEAAHRGGAPPRQAARHPRRVGGSPASGARNRRGRARQARNVVGRPRIYQAANGVWLTDRVQPGYLSGSGPARAGSRHTRPFHARGSAAHPGSAG
jgi:hypothetical protein